jgi:hypothetical protein
MGPRSPATSVLASLTTVGALLFLFFSLYEFPPRVNPKPHEALGQIVAQEAVKLLGPGGRVTLITRDTSVFKNPAIDLQIKSFSQTIKTLGGSVGQLISIKVDPLRIMSVPPGDFFQILKKASDADVIVSFLGPPVCSGAMPKQVNLKDIFEEKLLHVAVVSRRTASTAPPTSETTQGWFDHLYVLVTPANLSELSDPAIKH